MSKSKVLQLFGFKGSGDNGSRERI